MASTTPVPSGREVVGMRFGVKVTRVAVFVQSFRSVSDFDCQLASDFDCQLAVTRTDHWSPAVQL